MKAAKVIISVIVILGALYYMWTQYKQFSG